MDSDADKRMEEILRRAKIKVRNHLDTTLSLFKSMYDELSDEERRRLRVLLDEAIVLQRQASSIRPRVAFTVGFIEPDEEGKDLCAEMSPRTAMKAIQCWERGETYSPSSLSEFYGV